MKYLLLFAVIVVVLWLLRVGRPQNKSAKTTGNIAEPVRPKAVAMATCPTCGVHFPETDGAQGRLALYCSDKHRNAAET